MVHGMVSLCSGTPALLRGTPHKRLLFYGRFQPADHIRLFPSVIVQKQCDRDFPVDGPIEKIEFFDHARRG
jgi:hypothetical protein